MGLAGGAEVSEKIHHLGDGLGGKPTALLMDGEGRQLLVGSDSGRIYEWQLGGLQAEPGFVRSFAGAEEGTAITALAFVLGDVSMVVGDESGAISTWFRTEDNGERIFRRIHRLRSHHAEVTRIVPSLRDKQFLSGDSGGTLALHHMTSEQTFFQIPSGAGQLAALSFAPKANGFLALGTGGSLVHYGLDNPHPEITLKTLFGKIWYEGYGKAAYVWQSTGGTDEFEPKLSLVPLIFGTAKGTFYAMLFALPLSVLAAIYTAEFARPRLRSVVKPTVEIMASLPSVILGFLGGLWLAPLLERELAGTLLLFPFVPLVILVAASTWHFLPGIFGLRASSRFEIVAVVTLTLFASWLAYFLGPIAEHRVFGGSLLEWINQETNLGYDQRNCLVVGFAMGVAVIPLVFTVSEDALSGVPQHLRAGLPGPGSDSLADSPSGRPAHGPARHLLRGHDRLRPRRRRDHDRAHGHGQHSDHGMEHLQRDAHHRRQYRRRVARSPAAREPLPRTLSQRSAALRGDLRSQQSGRNRAPASQGEVRPPMNMVLRRGDPFIWLTGSALAFCLLMIGGLVVVILYNAMGVFWPRDLVEFEVAPMEAG